MAEELKGLIEKIKKEGIQAAEEKAGQIEAQAKEEARNILQEAKKEAARLIADAEGQTAKMRDNLDASLKQSARDLLLEVHGKIEAMLDKLIQLRSGEVLKSGELARIIAALIKNCSQQEDCGIVIRLNNADLANLEAGFLAELKEEAKKGIRLEPSDDISAGLTISYDGGKSHFDFTDKSVAGYISSYLRPKLARILSGL